MHLQTTDSFAALDFNATAEAEHAYWLSREKAAVCQPVEIDVNKFHDAAGLMPPMNWRSDTAQDTETFMLAEMYTRIGIRYFRMRDYSNMNHAQIVQRVEEVFYRDNDSQK